MTKYLGQAVLYCFLAFFILVGCSQDKDTAGDSKEKEEESSKGTSGEIVIASVREPDTVDIHNTTWADDANSHLYYSILQVDEDGNIVPGLVEDYTISEDSKVGTFHLKKNLTFHSGNPITAEAVKSSYERFIEMSPYQSDLASLDKIEVIDEHTFEMHWNEPNAPFLVNATTPYFGVLDTSVLDEDGKGFEKNPIASGPLKLIETNRGESLVYEPFENFDWGQAGPPKLDKVTFRFISDDDTRMLEFKKGTVNVLPDIPPQNIKELENEPGVTIERILGNGHTYLGMNNKRPIFEDVRVRQAIAMAVDREPIIEHALQGVGQPIFGPLPKTIFGYSQEIEDLAKEKYARNTEEAKKLLAAAGWNETNSDGVVMKDGKPFSVELWTTDEPVMQRIGQILQNQLMEVGIEIKLAVKEDAAIRAQAPEGAHEMLLWRYNWYDADILYSMFGEGQSTRMHYENAELDQLLLDAQVEMDPEKRLKVYEEAQTILVEESPWVPLFVREGVTAHRGLENFKKHPIRDIIMWQGVGLGQ